MREKIPYLTDIIDSDDALGCPTVTILKTPAIGPSWGYDAMIISPTEKQANEFSNDRITPA